MAALRRGGENARLDISPGLSVCLMGDDIFPETQLLPGHTKDTRGFDQTRVLVRIFLSLFLNCVSSGTRGARLDVRVEEWATPVINLLVVGFEFPLV